MGMMGGLLEERRAYIDSLLIFQTLCLLDPVPESDPLLEGLLYSLPAP